MRKITQLLHAAIGRSMTAVQGAAAAAAKPATRSAAATAGMAALPFKRKLLMEALEPRLLLSADLMPVSNIPALTAAVSARNWLDARAAAMAAVPEVHFGVQADAASVPLQLDAVGPIEGGARVAQTQSGSLSSAPQDMPGSVRYAVNLAEGQMLSAVATFDNRGFSAFYGRLQIMAPDGVTVVAEALQQPVLQLQGTVAPTAGTYEIVLTAERTSDLSTAHPGTLGWVLHAAVDAVLETEDLHSSIGRNDQHPQAQWLEDFRVLPLPDAQRTAVVGRLTPQNNDGRRDTDVYAITLAAGETLEAISSLSGQHGFLQLLNSQGQQVAAGTRVGEGMAWAGPVGLPTFVADAAGTYYLRAELYWDPSRSLEPLDYTLVVARNVSLDPDSSDELGLAGGQLAAVVNPPAATESALSPQATGPNGSVYFEATATAETVRIHIDAVADSSLGGGSWTPELSVYDEASNALLATAVAAESGWTWEVSAVVGARLALDISAATNGQFLLSLAGAQGENAAPAPTNSSLADGRATGASPWQWIGFSEAIRADRLQTAELLDAEGNSLGPLNLQAWGDNAGVSVSLPTNLANGIYSLVLAAGAVQDLTGQGSAAITYDFTVDSQAPVLESRVPRDQAEIGGDQQLQLVFNEPMNRNWGWAAAFYDASGSQVYPDWNWAWSEDGRTLSINLYGGLAGGSYELRFEPWVFEDLAGNAFDANPATPERDPLVMRFSIDSEVASLPALAAREPLGALIYSSGRNATLVSDTDTDAFEISLQEGQTFDAVISTLQGQPLSSLPQVALEIVDPTGLVVAAVSSTQAGRPLLIPGIAVGVGGTWTLRVSSPNGDIGDYNIGVVVGAAVQREFVEIDGVQQPGNHTRTNAEDLDSTSLFLADGIDRLASVGRFSPGFNAGTGTVVSDWDFFRFTLEAGQTASIVVAVEGTPTVSNLRLGLFDDSGDLDSGTGVLVGAAIAAPDADRAILDFTNSGDSAVTLYARPRADSNVRYSMVVTRGATFDVGAVQGLPQSLGPTGAVLGGFDDKAATGVLGGVADLVGNNAYNLSATDGAGFRWTVNGDGRIQGSGVDGDGASGFDSANYLQLDGYDGPGSAMGFYAENGAIDAAGRTLALQGQEINGWQLNRKVFVPGDDGFIRYLDQVSNHGSETRTVTVRMNSNLGSDNSTSVVATDGGEPQFFNSQDHWLVTDDSGDPLGTDPAVAQVLWGDGGLAPSSANLYGDVVERTWTLTVRPGETVSLLHFAVQAVDPVIATQTAQRLVGLPQEALQGLTPAELASIVNFNTGRAESFRVWANAGDAISVGVQALNNASLPFVLRAFDPDGNLRLDTGVADGSYAGLSTGFDVDTTGAWLVQVLAPGSAGSAYLLQVDGATGVPPAPQIVSSQPSDGRPVAALPAAIDVTFDQFIRPDSVQATDLLLGDALREAGVSVAGVDVLSGTTLRFRLTAGSLPEGFYGWSVVADAVQGHDGQGNLAAAGGFQVDQSGPVVLNHGDTLRRAQFNNLVFTFDEELDPTSVGMADVVSFTGPAGNDLRGNVYAVQASGNQVTVWFNTQTSPGDYTMVLGAGIQDLAGNALDQDGDGTPGEAVDDRYTAMLTVADADLVVTEVVADETVEAGQNLTVQWTVRNDGTEATSPGQAWYDLVRLIRGDGAVVSSLGVYRSQALAVGETYQQSLTFQLPLTVDLPAGDYRVEVWADGYQYLPETNNNNNSRLAAQPVTVTVPAVPDLVITDLVLPENAGIQNGFEISWQLRNQGAGGTSNGSYSLVELVDLDGNLVYINSQGEGNGFQYPAYQEYVWNDALISSNGAEAQSVTVYLPRELQAGQYRFRVTADIYNYIPELAGESNNSVLSGEFSVSLPDLRVVAVSAATSVTMGQTLSVAWDVVNDGSVALVDAYVYDRVELVNATTGEVAYTYDHYRYLNLALGQTISDSVGFTVPFELGLAQGDYRVRVHSDIYNYVGESDETNNTAEAADLLTVLVPALPDLVNSQITVPAEVAGNTSLTVQWTTVNQGTAATSRSFRDRIYLETTGGGLVTLGDARYFDTIAAGGSVARSATFVVPHTLVPGTYKVRIQSDIFNNITELAGEDNNLARSGDLAVTTAIVADLVIQSITPPDGVTLGQPVTVRWTGLNQGNGPLTTSTYDHVELVDATGVVRHTVDQWINAQGLQPGGTYEGSITFTPPISNALLEGDYRVRVTADRYGYQIESNENNNLLLSTQTFPLVAPATPDLVVQNIQVPAESAPANTRITLVWDEVNLGDAASTTGTNSRIDLIDANGNRVFRQQVAFGLPVGLAVGERVQRSLELVLPVSLAAGAYRARITTDISNQVAEYTEETNNTTISAAFSVTEAIRADLTNLRLNTALVSPVLFGTTLRVDYAVDNSGPGSTQNVTWTDRVQVIRASDGAVVATANVVAGNATGVAAGQSYSRTVDLALPIVGTWASGAYRVRVLADVNANLNESDRNDNSLLVDLDITVPPLANLTVTDVTIDPPLGVAGRTVTVSWVGRNIGDGNTLPRYGAGLNYFHDRVFLADSAGNTLRLLGEYELRTPLPPGGSLARVQQVNLPDDVVNSGYTIVVQTDVYDYINEHAGESDNRSVSAVFPIIQPPRVDLQAASVVLPATEAATGAPITLAWVTRNAGEADFAGSFNEVVQISTTADFSSDVRALSPVSRFTGTIAAGAQVARSAEVVVPVDLNGSNTVSRTWYVRVLSDNNNEVYEYSFENNNASASTSIVFTRPPLPDLRVDAVDAAAQVLAGGTVVVTYTVTNHGTESAGPRSDRILLQREDGSLWSVETFVRQDAPLAAGASQQLEARITLPLNSGNAGFSGRLRAQVVTDVYNEVVEYPNDSNNTRTDSDLITVSLPPLPDLLITQIALPSEALTESSLPLRWAVRNAGTAATAGGWTDRVYLTRNGNLNGDIRHLGDFSVETILAAGASIERQQTITLPRDTTGDWKIVVISDIGGQLYEGPAGEANNQVADDSSITLVQRPLPNLVVSSVTAPQNAFSSQQAIVRWTVTNTGTGATTVPLWRDAVYLSVDDVFDNSDVYLGQAENPGYLEVGAQYANAMTVTLPRGISGPYRLFVVADVHNNLYEGSAASGFEADNTSAPALTPIALTPPPDLVVRNISAPLSVFSGEPITIGWEVLNNDPDGRTRETSWTDRVWISTDTKASPDDIYLGEVRHLGALDSLEFYTGSLTAALPIGLIGNFHVLVATDIYGEVYEATAEGNNTAARENPTSIVLTPPPDLEIVDVDLPASVRAGTELTLRFRVENLGASDVPARQSWWTDSAWLSLDDQVDSGDLSLGSVGHYGSLAVDGGYDAVLRAILPANLPVRDDYRIILRTDASNSVFESAVGDANNTRVLGPLAVFQSRADLVVSSFTMPAVVEAGRTATFGWTVSNQGNGDSITAGWVDSLWVSLDDELGDNDDVLIGNVARAGVLAPQASYTVSVAPVLPFSLVGNGRFYVRTDGGGQVIESNDANNLSAVQTAQIQRSEADLRVSSAVVTPVAGDGRSFDLQFTVTNQGVASTNANAWVDGIWLSGDANIGAGDIRVGTVARSNPLPVGGSYTINTRITVPASVDAGNFRVLVRADDDNAVIEGTAEDNNTAAAAVRIGGLPAPDGQLPIGDLVVLRPDLTVVAVNPPTEAFSGQAVTIRWTVRNQGEDDVTNPYWWWSSYDQVYLSEDAFLDSGDTSLGYTNFSNHAAGADVERSLTANLPVGRSGLFYVLVKADAGGRVAEPDAESNNVGQSSTLFRIEQAPPADLVAGTVQVPADAVLGAAMSVTYSVSNQSSFAALGNWRDVLYLSRDDVFDTSDILFGAADVSGPVAGGGSYSRTVHASLPGVNPGDYKLIVRSDVRNVIPEQREDNNLSASIDAVELDVPELTLGTAFTGSFAGGNAQYFKVRVAAGEALRFSLDGPGDDVAHDLFVGFNSVPTRSLNLAGTGELFTPDPVVTIPSTEAGVYYVRIDPSPQGSGAFSLVANLVPFSLDRVRETRVGNTGEATVRIDGTLFNADTVFELVAADGTSYRAVEVSLKDAGRAFVTFDLFTAAVGDYDLRATRPGAAGAELSATLADAVQVIDGEGADAFLTISGPTAVQVNRDASFTLNYSNDGDADTLAPLIIITPSNGTSIGLSSKTLGQEPLFLLGTALDGPLDILRPGARYSTQVAYKTPGEAGFLTIEARPVQGDSTELITDWSMIERALRPASVDFAAWQQFWGRVQPRIGNTLGDLVGVLNDMAVRLSSATDPIRDVRALFAAQIARDALWRPASVVTGSVQWSDDAAAVAGQTVSLWESVGDTYRKVGSSLTDADGRFLINGVQTGNFLVSIESRNIDQDRDGLEDEFLPTISVDNSTDSNAGTVFLARDPAMPARQESRPMLTVDESGQAYMAWIKEDTLWVARRDGDQWVDAQRLVQGSVASMAMVASTKLLDGQNAGVMVTWVEGEGNEAELYFAVGRIASGQMQWSDAIRLTNDAVADSLPRVSADDQGRVTLVYLKEDTSIRDDTDLYTLRLSISAAGLVFTPAAVPAYNNLDPEAISIGGSWTIWEDNFLFHTALKGEVQIDAGVDGCDYNASVTGGLLFEVGSDQPGPTDSAFSSNLKVTVKGNAKAQYAWTADTETRDWKFKEATASVNASGEFSWGNGLLILLEKLGPAGFTASKLLQTGIGFVNRFTPLTITNGVKGSLGFSFEAMKWKDSPPTTNFRAPDDWGAVSMSLGGGAWLRATQDGVNDAKVEASLNFGTEFNLLPSPGLKKIFGNMQITAEYKIFSFSGSIDFLNYQPSDALNLQDASLADGVFSIDPSLIVGTGNSYGDNAMFGADAVATDLFSDGAAALSRAADGTLTAVWSRSVDPDTVGGTITDELRTAALIEGSWVETGTVPGADGFISGLRVMHDAAGRLVAVWTREDNNGNEGYDSFEALNAARDKSDIWYAVRGSDGVWSAAAAIATTDARDMQATLGLAADGNLLVAWVAATETGDTLFSTSFNGLAFGPLTTLATGGHMADATMASIDGAIELYWTHDDTATEALDPTILTARLSNGIWSAPGAFSYAALPQEAAAASMSSHGFSPAAVLPHEPVPEDCLKCKPEKLKRIPEAAPDCRPGGGQSAGAIDTKKCEQKIITYAPCVTRPSDPNDIIGPDGYGEANWIKASDALPYKIRFENQASATAPAQVVVITQTLDDNLDARSFRITGFGFADVEVLPTESRSFYSGRLDLTETQGIFLDVSARIDTATRLITWTFTTIDPATGDVPVDANLGFLLPNDETGRGDGFVTYTIKPLRTAVTGMVIDAQARIVFDSEGPIDTPAIFHTLDAGRPTSAVQALPETTDSNTFVVRWAGTDAEGGSAIRDFEVYVSEDGGAWALWLFNTTDTEALFEGEPGRTYAFYSVARDNAGNIEAAPAVADAQIRVLAQTGSVAGTVFNDIDGDGLRGDGEGARAGWTVFLDADSDGIFDGDELSVTTDDAGNWLFADVQPQTLRIGIVLPASHVVTSPVAGYHDVAVAAGDAITGRDFGVLELGSIAGVQFDDLNGNGQRDSGEQGLAGWTIFIDEDDDGQLDDDERSTVTAGDGSYAFTNLRPGAYLISQVAQDGWIQTRPGTAATNGQTNGQTAFAVTLSGSLAAISLPACACGGTVSTVAAQQAGWDEQLVELDALRADPGHAGVDGSGVRVVVIDTGIDATHPFFAGRIVYQYDFADNDNQAIDRNGHGTHVAGVIAGADSMFGGVAQGAELIVLKVFGDDGSGSFRNLERALQWVNNNAEAYNIGVVNLSLGDGGNWTDAASRYGLGDEFAALAARNIISVAASGNNYAGVNALGVAYPGSDPAVLAVGAVWTGDFGGPWKFGNGGVDEATGEDRIASFSQRDPDQIDTFAPGARLTSAAVGGGVRSMQGTSQSAAYVSGVAALAQQLAQQTLGRSLTVAEFRNLLVSTAVSINDGDDERDNVANSGLDYPRLNVKAMADAIVAMGGGSQGGGGDTGGSGSGDPAPVDPSASGGGLQIDLVAGQRVTDADFGVFQLGQVSGRVYADLNGNGQRDDGEAGIAGATVFVDSNASGTLDDGETAITTGADGSWVLANLLPGSLTVSETVPAGWARTGQGSYTVSVTSGLNDGSLDFGRQDIAPVARDDAASTLQGRSVSGNVLDNDSDPGRPDNSLLEVSRISGPANGNLVLGPDGAFTYTPNAGFKGTDSFRYAVSDGVSSSEAVVQLSVTHDVLVVSQLTGRHDGFEVVFSRPIALPGLDVGGAAADVVVSNAAGTPVAGSLFVAADGRSARFLASGGPLADGSYSVRLRAGAEALRDLEGVALNGQADPVGGSDHIGQFTVARNSAVSVGVADTARGPGQRLGVGLNDTGLAVVLSQGSGVTDLRFTLAYDPALLGVATLSRGAGLPTDASFTVTELGAGRLAVVITAASGMPAGALTLAQLTATVPTGAVYGAAHVIDLQNLVVNGGAHAALDDDGVHVVAYPGDLNFDRQHSVADVALLRGLLDGSLARLAQLPLVDAALLGDVNGSGRFDAVDPLRLMQALSGNGGQVLAIPGSTPVPVAPPVVVVAPPRPVPPRPVPRPAMTPTWVAPLVSPSATISANVSIRVTL